MANKVADRKYAEAWDVLTNPCDVKECFLSDLILAVLERMDAYPGMYGSRASNYMNRITRASTVALVDWFMSELDGIKDSTIEDFIHSDFGMYNLSWDLLVKDVIYKNRGWLYFQKPTQTLDKFMRQAV